MNLMKAESPGPSVSKLVPKVQSTAKILYTIYFGMTLAQIVCLLIGKVPLFDTCVLPLVLPEPVDFGIVNDSIGKLQHLLSGRYYHLYDFIRGKLLCLLPDPDEEISSSF